MAVPYSHLSDALEKRRSQRRTDPKRHVWIFRSEKPTTMTSADPDPLGRVESWLGENDSTLTEIDLSGRNLGDDEAERMAESLRRTDASVKKVDLSFNVIRNDGARAVARSMMRRNSSVECVDLSSNAIRDDGARAWAAVLRESSSSLEELRLDFNEIGDAGARTFGDALASNSSLRRLDLRWNRITDEGARAFANGLRSNFTLSEFKLDKRIDGGIADAIEKLLERNRRLRALTEAWTDPNVATSSCSPVFLDKAGELGGLRDKEPVGLSVVYKLVQMQPNICNVRYRNESA